MTILIIIEQSKLLRNQVHFHCGSQMKWWNRDFILRYFPFLKFFVKPKIATRIICLELCETDGFDIHLCCLTGPLEYHEGEDRDRFSNYTSMSHLPQLLPKIGIKFSKW